MSERYPRKPSSQRGYDATWRRLRRQVLEAEPLCRFCRQAGKLTPATVVDHIVPIREAPTRRLDRTNLAPLCTHCHNAVKQSEEKLGYDKGVGADGFPTDPRHPFNHKRKW